MSYACPFCEYEAPTAGSVKAHITAMTSGEHKGRQTSDFDDDDELLVDESDEDTAQSDSRSSDPDTSDPVKDAPDTDSGADTGGSQPTCDECGGSDVFDASEHTDYDYGCSDCSDETGWVVWNE